MIRKKTGLKELTLVVLCGAALVSVACGDDDDTGTPGTSGSAGTSAAGSNSTGGSAGSKSTGGSAGTGTGGTTTAGTSSGGTSSAGTSGGGSGGSAGSAVGGESTGGVGGEGGMAGEGGAPIIGGADAGGAGGEGGAPVVVVLDTLKNLSFEAPLLPNGTEAPPGGTKVFAEWVNTSTPDGSSYINWDGEKSGTVKLAQWNANAYVARTEQVVSPIANGKYKFSIFVNRHALTEFNESYVYAKGHNATALAEEKKMNTDLAVGNAWVEIAVTDIQVTSGAITVGVYTDAKAGGWINFDDASLVRLGD